MKFDNRDNYIKLGLKISYYRKLKGLTQEQLAEILDMSTAFIGKIEAPNIVKAVSLDTLFEIARILDIPAYKLLFFEED
jgi:transcriptional regulator with XRE-family HTH domain